VRVIAPLFVAPSQAGQSLWIHPARVNPHLYPTLVYAEIEKENEYMASSVLEKCAHPACQCQVITLNDKYCSELCRTGGAEEIEIACDCGHPACAHVQK